LEFSNIRRSPAGDDGTSATESSLLTPEDVVAAAEFIAARKGTVRFSGMEQHVVD